MTNAITETKKPLSKEAAQALNRRRWASYLARFKTLISQDRLATRALMILVSSINAKERWVKITELEFKKYHPEWDEKAGEQTVDYEGHEVRLRIYRDMKTGHCFYSRLIQRKNRGMVIPGWHLAAVNGSRSRGVDVTKELSDEIYSVGNSIIRSINENEGVWRKPYNPMLEVSTQVEETM